MSKNDKILLVLDLDETLIHARTEPLGRTEDFRVFNYFVYRRPHLEAFLRQCSVHFRLAVWSSASDDYVEEIVKGIFPGDIPLDFVWGRSRCTYTINYKQTELDGYADPYNHYNYVKRLHKIKKQGYDLDRALIVDDSPEKCVHNYGNAIYIGEYKGDEDDAELLHLSEYLTGLKDAINVRSIEKRFWRKR